MKKAYYTEKEVKQLIKDRIKYGVTQMQIAKELKVCRSYLSEVLADKKSIGSTLINNLGFEIVYIKKGSKCSKD
jgi:hypothetical protein